MTWWLVPADAHDPQGPAPETVRDGPAQLAHQARPGTGVHNDHGQRPPPLVVRLTTGVGLADDLAEAVNHLQEGGAQGPGDLTVSPGEHQVPQRSGDPQAVQAAEGHARPGLLVDADTAPVARQPQAVHARGPLTTRTQLHARACQHLTGGTDLPGVGRLGQDQPAAQVTGPAAPALSDLRVVKGLSQERHTAHPGAGDSASPGNGASPGTSPGDGASPGTSPGDGASPGAAPVHVVCGARCPTEARDDASALSSQGLGSQVLVGDHGLLLGQPGRLHPGVAVGVVDPGAAGGLPSATHPSHRPVHVQDLEHGLQAGAAQ